MGFPFVLSLSCFLPVRVTESVHLRAMPCCVAQGWIGAPWQLSDVYSYYWCRSTDEQTEAGGE